MEVGFAMLQNPGCLLLRETSHIFLHLNCEEQKKNGCEYINSDVPLCFTLAKIGATKIWNTSAYHQG